MNGLLICVVALGMCGTALAAGTPTKGTPTKDKAMQQIETMIANAKVDTKNPAWRTTLTKPTVATFDSSRTYSARMATNKGAILIRFMPNVAPMHVRTPKPNGMNCVRARFASCSGANRPGSKRSGSTHSFLWRWVAKMGIMIRVPVLIASAPNVASCAASRVMMGTGG